MKTTLGGQPSSPIHGQALYADKLRMHSAWIGEHHFNSLGVLSCPDLVLSYIAARTENIRLAPAVTVLPLHHPIRVAEQWATLDLLSNGRVDFAAGRGYDRREYRRPRIDEDNQRSRGASKSAPLWSGEGRMTTRASNIVRDCASPEACAEAAANLLASFSKPRSARRGARLAGDRGAFRRDDRGPQAGRLYPESAQVGKKPGG